MFLFFQNITDLPKKLVYSLRFPGRLESCGDVDNETCTWQTYRIFPKDMFEDRSRSDTGAHPAYLFEKFLFLHRALFERFWIRHSKISLYWVVAAMQLPYPAHVESDLLVRMPYMIPFILLISFNFAFVNSVRYIVNEKEKHLKEAMKIMGLANWMHLLCWFIRSIAMLFIPITIITIAFLVCIPFIIQIKYIFSNSFLNRRHRLEIRTPYFRRQNLFVCFYCSLATAFARSCLVLRLVRFSQERNQQS